MGIAAEVLSQRLISLSVRDSSVVLAMLASRGLKVEISNSMLMIMIMVVGRIRLRLRRLLRCMLQEFLKRISEARVITLLLVERRQRKAKSKLRQE